MTWIRRLYDTYDQVYGREPDDDGPRLMPISHSSHRVHIEIILDGDGRFLDAAVVSRGDALTQIPCTEESAGRSGTRPVSHPLSDKLQYVAADFTRFGGEVTSGFAKDPGEPHRQYVEWLDGWAGSEFGHPKVAAILSYVRRGTVVQDLVRDGLLHLDPADRLLGSWAGDRASAPAVFISLGTAVSQHDAVVRWRVEVPGDPRSATWSDPAIIQSWIDYYQSRQTLRGFCMVTGREDWLAVQHPARLRHGADKAKLISSNDTSGFTFRGRFVDADEAVGVSFEVTQKAHNALRWLLERKQAHRDGSQSFVIWSPGVEILPLPWLDTDELLAQMPEDERRDDEPADTAVRYAERLKSKMAGYGATLGARDDVIVMGMDSATPGRLSITFFREIMGATLLDRIEQWHTRYAWYQDYGMGRQFIGVPAPREIVEAAYGRRASEELRRATFERLMPCILDGLPAPRDLVRLTVQRACSPASFDRDRRGRRPDWEKTLGVACSLIRGTHRGTELVMGLDQGRTDRDYLYGRLLALADNIERFALDRTGETRETNADRLFQRFAQHPAKTWRTLELALRPYMSRLRSNDHWRGFLVRRNQQLDELFAQFQSPDDFNSDRPLTSEFLLGFHVQRRELLGQKDENE